MKTSELRVKPAPPVVTRSSETNVKAGYGANVVGFGWTNAVFVELLQSLSPAQIAHISESASPKR